MSDQDRGGCGNAKTRLIMAKAGMAKHNKKLATKDSGAETVPEEVTAFQRVQLARHPDRPYTLDFIERLFEEFVELHGDRRFADDPAIICGMARFHGLRSEEHTSELQSRLHLVCRLLLEKKKKKKK